MIRNRLGASMWLCAALALAGCGEGGSDESAGGAFGGEPQSTVDDPCGAIGTWSLHEPAQERCGMSLADSRASIVITPDNVAAGTWSVASPIGDASWTLDPSACVLTTRITRWPANPCLVGVTARFDLAGGTCEDTFAKPGGAACDCYEAMVGCTLTKVD